MNISQRLRTCAKHTALDAVIELLNEAADEIDRLSATQPADVTDWLIQAMDAADAYANAASTAHVENLYGSSKAYTRESFAHANKARSELQAILAIRPVQVPMTDGVRERALDLLATLFDAYENGPACYESPDDCAGYLGNAVQIDHDTFHVIASLLNTHRPITPAQAKKEAP